MQYDFIAKFFKFVIRYKIEIFIVRRLVPSLDFSIIRTFSIIYNSSVNIRIRLKFN